MISYETLAMSGVILMLIAYIINIADWMHNNHPMYICMNLIGGGLASYASYTIKNWPFVIMEGAWTIVAIWALYIYFKRDFRNGKKQV